MESLFSTACVNAAKTRGGGGGGGCEEGCEISKFSRNKVRCLNEPAKKGLWIITFSA